MAKKTEEATTWFGTPKSDDIVNLILDDHKPLKRLIKVLQNDDIDFSERKAAFLEFAPLLTIHAKSEEQVLYNFMKNIADLREQGFEGDVEHGLADQMVKQSKKDAEEDVWTANVKVLAGLVENHIKEEESDVLPAFKKHSEAEERKSLAQKYLQMKSEIEAMGDTEPPFAKSPEKTLERQTQMELH